MRQVCSGAFFFLRVFLFIGIGPDISSSTHKKMGRAIAPALVVLFLLLWCCLSQAQDNAAQPQTDKRMDDGSDSNNKDRPNIILIVTDDQVRHIFDFFLSVSPQRSYTLHAKACKKELQHFYLLIPKNSTIKEGKKCLFVSYRVFLKFLN